MSPRWWRRRHEEPWWRRSPNLPPPPMPQEPKSRTWHRDAETDRRLWLVLVTQLGPGTTFSTDYAWQLYLAGTRGALRRARRGEIQASLDRHVTTGRLVPKIDDSGQWAYEINEEWWKEHMTWSS